MEPERAKDLLARERERIESSLRSHSGEPLEADDEVEPGDTDDESLYQDEFDAGRVRELQDQLAAVERAEQRLAAGTYGVSIVSGEPIPDERLEILPAAERTAAEEGG